MESPSMEHTSIHQHSWQVIELFDASFSWDDVAAAPMAGPGWRQAPIESTTNQQMVGMARNNQQKQPLWTDVSDMDSLMDIASQNDCPRAQGSQTVRCIDYVNPQEPIIVQCYKGFEPASSIEA